MISYYFGFCVLLNQHPTLSKPTKPRTWKMHTNAMVVVGNVFFEQKFTFLDLNIGPSNHKRFFNLKKYKKS